MSAAIAFSECRRQQSLVKLGDIAEFIMGQAPPGDASNFEGKGTVFVKAGEFGQLHPIVREWTTKPLRYAKSGDVLICVVGATAGKLNLGIDCAIGRSVAAIRPGNKTFHRFLYFQLLPKVFGLRASSTGSAQGVINKNMLANIELFLPDVAEQWRIVAEIEKQFTRLDAGVAALRRVQANLKRYRAAVLKAACEGRLVPTEAELARAEGRTYETGEQLLARILADRRKSWKGRGKYKEPTAPDTTSLPSLPEGWAWATTEQLSAVIVDCPHSTAKFVAEGKPCVDTTCIKPGRVVRENLRFVTPETYQKRIERLVPASGDIIFAREGTVGTAVVIPKGLEPCLGQRVMLMRPDACVLPAYLEHCLNSQVVRSQYLQKIIGSTAPHLNVAEVRRLVLPLPPLAEQKCIVDEVERRLSVIEELEAAVTTNLQRAIRLRQSILQRAFAVSATV